jgi:hypothetical protein
MCGAAHFVPYEGEGGGGGGSGGGDGGGGDKGGAGAGDGKGADTGKGGDKTGADGKGGADDKGKGADDKGGDDKKSKTLIGGDDDADGDGDGDGDGDDKGDPKPKAPEKYEAFTLPDGMKADEKALEAFLPIAKALDLTQEQAQKLVDFEVERMGQYAQTMQDTWKAWEDSARMDTEIGGAALEASLKSANIALADPDKGGIGSKALRVMLHKTGLGNHPEFIRAFARIGKVLGEPDTASKGGNGGGNDGGEDARLAAMYPKTAGLGRKK